MEAAVTEVTQLPQRLVEIQHSVQSLRLAEATEVPEGVTQQMVVREAAVVGIILVKESLWELSVKVIRVAVRTVVATEQEAVAVALREPVEMRVLNISAAMVGPEFRQQSRVLLLLLLMAAAEAAASTPTATVFIQMVAAQEALVAVETAARLATAGVLILMVLLGQQIPAAEAVELILNQILEVMVVRESSLCATSLFLSLPTMEHQLSAVLRVLVKH
jgi:hypothetical protein